MKKILLSLVCLVCAQQLLFSQEQAAPTISIKGLEKEEKPVRISDVKIDVSVVGALAVTTVELTIQNPNDRVLEGELNFPLAEGQSISRFALDINGKVREGVVVEKAKGQKVFESTIRKNIDPGLLEKTQGNSFRTRVYPLPERGSRKVLIAYEQELACKDGSYTFFLPVEYGGKLDNFSLNVVVHKQSYKPTINKNPWSSFTFNQEGEAYTASYSAKGYQAKGQLVFSVPSYGEATCYVEKGAVSSQTVFYAQSFPQYTAEKAKRRPSRIALVWDVSSSMENRDLQLETELLEQYFTQLDNLTVDFYTFSCFLSKPRTFTVVNGKWEQLKSAVESVDYDGATQLGSLDFSTFNVDEVLLFTDGLTNLGKQLPVVGKAPVVTVASALKADHSLLRYISQVSGGTYVNLMRHTPAYAVNLLLNESMRLILADYNKNEIADLTTSLSVGNPEEGFSVAGKLLKNKAQLILSFGVGSFVLYTDTIVVNAKEATSYGGLVERIWVEKKIAELDLLYDKNRDEIEALGRKYNIVTRNTSLIVLDDVEDYVRHSITPPAELLDEYNRLLQEREEEVSESKEERMEYVLSMLEDRLDWWNSTFPKGKPKLPKKEKPVEQPAESIAEVTPNTTEQPDTDSNEENIIEQPVESPSVRYLRSSNVSSVIEQSESYNGQSVSGRAVDADTGEPLPHVTIVKKGTNVMVVSNLYGSYTISAAPGDTLIFSFIGYSSLEATVTGSWLDVQLVEDAVVMDEVVIVTAHAPVKRMMYTGSVSVVRAEEIAEEIEDDYSYMVVEQSSSLEQALEGRVAGLQVVAPEEQAEVFVRGTSSISSGTPLYIVDGVAVESLDGINESEVEEMATLKDASAAALYGARAASGVVIITTKNGAASKKQALAAAIELNEWTPDAPYINALADVPVSKLYKTYLSVRTENKNTPSFFLDVSYLFEQKGLKDESLIILSNLVEMELEDYALMRVLAHRLSQLGYIEYAIGLFEQVLKLRPEEPQSYRDLGLAYEQNEEYQKAIDMLYTIVKQEWDDRFPEVELFAIEEMNHIIEKAKLEKQELDLSKVDRRIIRNMPVDIRIVLNWDTDNSDMDLWVTDPYGEKCYYSNSLTRIGGLISEDFTEGYGPEVFLLKEAVKGKYTIEADYFGSNEQTLIGPTTIYLDIYTRYSTEKEEKKTITLRLSEEQEVSIGEIFFK